MAFLFDTDAISEVLKPRPLPAYVAWLRTIPRAEQFTNAVVVGELFKGAYRSPDAARHLRNIEARVLPAVTVLPYDVEIARVYGGLQAQLEEAGRGLADADLQIAATAVHHGLELVTGNLRHFRRVTGLRLPPSVGLGAPPHAREHLRHAVLDEELLQEPGDEHATVQDIRGEGTSFSSASYSPTSPEGNCDRRSS